MSWAVNTLTQKEIELDMSLKLLDTPCGLVHALKGNLMQRGPYLFLLNVFLSVIRSASRVLSQSDLSYLAIITCVLTTGAMCT